MARYPDAAFCVAGDFNTDVGVAPEYELSIFYGPKRSTALLLVRLHEVGMSCVTGRGIPPAMRPIYPPIDHIALRQRDAEGARVASVWAGSDGQGKAIGDRIGIVVELMNTARSQP